MDEVIVEFKYRLTNGEIYIAKIKDVDPSATQADITSLGNSLIAKRGHHKGVQFDTLLQSTKIVTSREIF